MRIDQFRVRIQQIQREHDRRRLSELLHDVYPDVVLEVHESLGSDKGAGGTPIDFSLVASSKGIFVLKKVVERFDPWLTIEGQAKLDKSDFPSELFRNVAEGGVGKQWTDVKKRVLSIMRDTPTEIRDADYYRVIVSQIDSEGRDRRYLNEVRHQFSDAFLKINKTIGPTDVEVGTPSDFRVEKSEMGYYVLKKCIERFDPWITILSVKQFDRVDMPDDLFGTVSEGGVGRNWSEAAKERVDQLDWP